MKRIALVVCSSGKSPILRQALDSLLHQQTHAGWTVDSLIIVWNGDSTDIERAKRSLNDFPFGDSHGPIQVCEVVESRRGIPFARNRGVEVARSRGIDWLYFMDDDCLADGDLLVRLTERASRDDAQVVAGGWEIVPVGDLSTWLPLDDFGLKHYEIDGRKCLDGDILPTAFTRNVLFDLTFIETFPPRYRRFDEVFADSGGSDTRFFFEVSRRGGKIVFAADARVSEKYSDERLTLRWHIRRRIRNAQLKFLRYSETGEKLFVRKSLASSIFSILWRGPLSIVLLPLTPLSHRQRRWVGSMALRLAPYLGVSLLCLGFRYHEYAGRFRFTPLWKKHTTV